MTNQFDYFCHGMTVRSELALEEAASSSVTGFDAQISIADVPSRLPGCSVEGAFFQATKTTFLLNVPNVARYLVKDGCQIDIDPSPQVASPRHFLYGAPMAALLLQQGRLILQGSAVQTRHGALLLLGQPASGKSIVAAALHKFGFPLIADDLCVVDSQSTSLLPGPRFHWLWGHDVEQLGLAETASQMRPGVDRHFVPLEPQATDPLPIFAVCVLDAWNNSIARLVSISGAGKSGGLVGNLYHRSLLEACYEPPEYLQRISPLFALPSYRLWSPRKNRSLAATIDELCSALEL